MVADTPVKSIRCASPLRTERRWSCLVALAALLVAGPVRAEPIPSTAQDPIAAARPARAPPPRGDPLTMPAAYRPFAINDYVMTGGGIALVVMKFAIGPLATRHHGGVLVDEGIRDGLRFGSERQRRAIRDASDALLTALVSYPFFEAVALAGWYRQSHEVAVQMALMNAQAMAITAGLQAIANVAASRERPYGRDCGAEKPAQGRDCDSRDRYFSFFSGHTSQAFVSAALVCTHNDHLPLYGDGPGGAIACGTTLTLAAAAGAMRVAGDQHYLSDVVAGAMVGTLVGFVAPRWLHYGFSIASNREGAAQASVLITPTPTGLWMLGWF